MTPEPEHPHTRKKRHPTGAAAAPAPAPRPGNMNALKHGRRFARIRKLGMMLAANPKTPRNAPRPRRGSGNAVK
ncbi:MAG: hypothetical protein E6J43_06275 [Chloroflexi bacterium]|nr:MAG: hypothetical protein E6J43_06275 [Chloroflexota bacterium]